MMDVFGVVAGHLYYFLLEVLPTTKGWNLLQTPSFLCVSAGSLAHAEVGLACAH